MDGCFQQGDGDVRHFRRPLTGPDPTRLAELTRLFVTQARVLVRTGRRCSERYRMRWTSHFDALIDPTG